LNVHQFKTKLAITGFIYIYKSYDESLVRRLTGFRLVLWGDDYTLCYPANRPILAIFCCHSQR